MKDQYEEMIRNLSLDQLKLVQGEQLLSKEEHGFKLCAAQQAYMKRRKEVEAVGVEIGCGGSPMHYRV